MLLFHNETKYFDLNKIIKKLIRSLYALDKAQVT